MQVTQHHLVTELNFKFLHRFPRKVSIFTAKVTVRGSLLHHRSLQLNQSFLHCTVRVDMNGQWVRHANSRLGYPTRSIRGRAINFSCIFAREGAATVGTPSTVSVNNDFSTCQTRITMWSTNHETARRVQMIYRLVVEILLRYHSLDYMFHQVGMNLFVCNFIIVLSRNDHSVYSLWHHTTIFLFVFHSNLCLTIRANPVKSSIFADICELGA
ncbi:hypothetical protein Plhal304r1_c028g0092541 [Plasmopara halstedii]